MDNINDRKLPERGYKFLKFFLGWFFKFWYNPKVYGSENIPKDGPILITANHKHVMDQCSIIVKTKRVIHYMAKDEYFNKLYGHSNQDVTGRRLVFSFKDKYRDSLNDKFNYMADHTSHTHTIPANKKINKVLYALKKGQTVKLEGYLVDVYNSDFFRFCITSLSLTDIGYNTERGGGSCEVMYVTKVQVGDKVYE